MSESEPSEDERETAAEIPSAARDLKDWLPPRDSNPDMLIQSQLSYH